MASVLYSSLLVMTAWGHGRIGRTDRRGTLNRAIFCGNNSGVFEWKSMIFCGFFESGMSYEIVQFSTNRSDTSYLSLSLHGANVTISRRSLAVVWCEIHKHWTEIQNRATAEHNKSSWWAVKKRTGGCGICGCLLTYPRRHVCHGILSDGIQETSLCERT